MASSWAELSATDAIHWTIDTYHWCQEMIDPRVEPWPLIASPLPLAAITLLYLVAVLLGPKLMKHRQPWNLRPLLIAYSFCLVLLSGYMFTEFVLVAYLSGYSLTCQPMDWSDDPLPTRMAAVTWWFFFSKQIELVDTIFFILRKKNNQISFLHVYHHGTVGVLWWLVTRYVAGGQSFFVGMLNSFVHVVMYTYYTLSAMGPHMQKYLWWKRYLTKLQLSQLALYIVHHTVNLSVPCKFAREYNYVGLIYVATLIVLFLNFYIKAYSGSRSQTSVKVQARLENRNGYVTKNTNKNGYVYHHNNNGHSNGYGEVLDRKTK